MRHQPYDVLPGLRLHLAPQRLLLRVGRAREREVLPDQQPQLVADVVEVLALVDPAAPDPDRSTPAPAACVQPRAGTAPGDPGREHVVRDPVDAPREQPLPVDDEGEPGPVRIGGGVELDGPEPDPPPPASPAGRPSGCSVSSTSYSGCSPYPRGHHSPRRALRAVTTALVAVPGQRHRDRRPPPPPGASSAQPGLDSGPLHVDANVDLPSPSSSTVTRGRTRAIRAVDQCSSRTGRQIPAVTRVGPQSQPKEQAILRMYW